MSNNCSSVVHNHYYCGSGCSHDEPAAAALPMNSAQFPWTSGSVLDPANKDYSTFADPETLTPLLGIASRVGTDGIAHMGLSPFHRTTKLIDLSMLKFPLPTGYIGAANLDIVVLDYAGNVLRTISTASLNLISITDYSWAQISLSTVQGDLDILAGEVVAGRLTMDTANSPSTYLIYHLSGTGQFL